MVAQLQFGLDGLGIVAGSHVEILHIEDFEIDRLCSFLKRV